MNSLALHLSAELKWMNDSKQKLWTKHTELFATGQLKILVVVYFFVYFGEKITFTDLMPILT